jgi:mannose-6-phosphate isomerase
LTDVVIVFTLTMNNRLALCTQTEILGKNKISGEKMKDVLVDLRPWGKFEQFICNEISTVKILYVTANSTLSLQSHQKREEMWIALDDGVMVEIDAEKKVLSIGERVFIPKGVKHRLSAEEKSFRVLEISFGEFDENDITRFEDAYGRV